MNLTIPAFLLLALAALAPASAASISTADVLREVDAGSGLCFHIGAADGATTAKLATSGKLIIHGLERDSAKVRTAREKLQATGIYGQVAIESWNGKVLPYADSLANYVVVQDKALAEAEVLRVLAPNGIAFFSEGDKWRRVQKEWPKDLDEWTHSRHGAGGNMVSDDNVVAAPTTVRWVSGPAQDAGGQKWYYDHVLVTANGRNYYMYEKEIIARDSFNGAFLWRRPLTADVFRELGTEVPPFLRAKEAAKPIRQAGRVSKVRPVAIGEKVYVAAEGMLFAMNGATGKTTEEFGSVNTPRELLVSKGHLVVADTNGVRAYNAATRAKLWDSGIVTERIVAGDGKVFCLAGKVVAALDIQTGTELWRSENAEIDPATTCTYHNGTLVLEMSSWRDDAGGSGVVAYSAEEGKVLWKKEFKPDMTHYKEARAFFARDLVWLQSSANAIVGYDPKTGAEKQTWGSRGKHCASPVATGRFFMAPECEFTDLETGERARARMFKSACRLPFIPANGLVYTFPVQCECFPMLRGYMGMTAEPMPTSAGGELLERVAKASQPTSTSIAGGEWPMYRRDVYRSAATKAGLSSKEPRQRWSVNLAGQRRELLAQTDWQDDPFTHGRLTPPVVADGKVFAALPDAHRVVAVDAPTGTLKWSFTAGGRVDLPPTIDDGLCLFGSHDGWVYCLDARDGSLLWRRRVAPHEARIPAYGQMESISPAPGSVLVENGIGYVSAGRHPMCEEGVQVVAFRVRSGELLWQKKIDDLTSVITNWYGPTIAPKVKTGLDFEPVDILVKDGDTVAMSRWRFNPANGDWKLAVASTNYQALGQSVPRGAWGYGIRQTKQVLPKLALAFDEKDVYRAPATATALVVAGDTQIRANGTQLEIGEAKVAIPGPVVRDGLAVAYGRLYAATAAGELLCFE